MSVVRLSKYIKQQDHKLLLALGEFTLQPSALGQGGNGVVYAASLGGKEVAIKFLVTEASGNTRKQKLSRFLAEYFNIILLEDTRGIVKYVDYDLLKFSDDQGDLEIPVIIMKKYNGSLANSQKGVSKEGFISLFTFLIDTVEKIHKEGIIHRDIKPENILIDNKGLILGDFGIASYNPEIFSVRALTGKNERVGNRLFSAPEQEKAGIDPHPTMDIFAIGQVLQWYVTRATHEGTGRMSILKIIDELDSVYDSIIEICLQNNPQNRFQSIQEIKNVLINKRSKKQIWDYISLFHDTCVSNFPKTKNGFAYHDNPLRIDRFFEDLKNRQSDFSNHLWWHNGLSNNSIKLKKKGETIWKIGTIEYKIIDLWIHHDPMEYNDYVLMHYSAMEPFSIDGEKTYFAITVDEQHYISHSEYENGFAEIDDEIISLSDHDVEFTERASKEGYIFISSEFNCVLLRDNDLNVKEFISEITSDHPILIEDLKAFSKKISKHKHSEVWENL